MTCFVWNHKILNVYSLKIISTCTQFVLKNKFKKVTGLSKINKKSCLFVKYFYVKYNKWFGNKITVVPLLYFS